MFSKIRCILLWVETETTVFILISLLIFWAMQYVLHITMILGEMSSRKKQDPQIKELAGNFVDYFIM